MEVMQDWTLRKRTAHNTACWDCYRCHRACDGARPCKRCFDLGRGASCRDPAPNERIPRKRKRSNSKHKDNLPIEKKALYFYIVEPDIFTPSNPPPFENGCTSQSFPPCIPSASRPCSASKNKSNEEESLSLSQGFQPKKGEELNEGVNQRSILDRPHSTSYLTPRRHKLTHVRPYEIPPSVEALAEEILIETEETVAGCAGHHKATAAVFQSLPLSKDLGRFSESLFTPFGVGDSTQPFMVTRTTCIDWAMLDQVLHGCPDEDAFCPVLGAILVTASPSFCDLAQISEDEILGTNFVQILPLARVKLPAYERPYLRYFYPQPKTRVSPIFRIQPYWRLRSGLFLHTYSTMQIFYAHDGTMSFVVLGIEAFTFTDSTALPFPPPLQDLDLPSRGCIPSSLDNNK